MFVADGLDTARIRPNLQPGECRMRVTSCDHGNERRCVNIVSHGYEP